jgi:hypothetical protein
MHATDLDKLHRAVEWLVRQQSFSKAVERLQGNLSESTEPFVWTTVSLNAIPVALPHEIKSCWIFHLKRDVPSGSHFHPNSVQHRIPLNGQGRSIVGGTERPLIPLGSPGRSIDDMWSIIREGVPHEFFPVGMDMTVVSFHTCPAAELEEIASEGGARRLYEPPGPSRAQEAVARQTVPAPNPHAEPSRPMPPTANKQLIQRFVDEVINRQNLNALDSIVAADFVEHVPFPGQGPGREGLRHAIQLFTTAFPEIHWPSTSKSPRATRSSAASPGRARIAVPSSASRPTGRRVQVWGVVIDVVRNGTFAESRILMDSLSLMQQLGALPNPGAR